MLEIELPRRWAHSQGVAARARSLADRLGGQADLVEAAAWVHDVGYAKDAALTGFHQLDGARFLRDRDVPDVLCCLVAYHSSAVTEAEERGMSAMLFEEFEQPFGAAMDALTACDMSTTPDGEFTDASARVAEVLTRYAPDTQVHRAVSRCRDELIGAAQKFFGPSTL